MAYADVLDSTTPGDLTAVGLGDDRIREMKRAIRQRLGSFFVDVDADPLVPKANSIPSTAITGTITPSAGAVGPGELANNAVTQAKIADAAVGTAELIDDNVTEAKLGTTLKTVALKGYYQDYTFTHTFVADGFDTKSLGAWAGPTTAGLLLFVNSDGIDQMECLVTTIRITAGNAILCAFNPSSANDIVCTALKIRVWALVPFTAPAPLA